MSTPAATVVHPHFHLRRTGVTRHVEELLRALPAPYRSVGLGQALAPDLPRTTLWEVHRQSRRGPVLWHAHRNLELLTGLILRALSSNVRVLFTRHASHRPSRYTQALLARADEVVALTSQMAAGLSRPCRVVGHGIDLARFRPPPDRDAAWRALGLGGGRGIGVIGRVRPAKGQGDFVRAWAALPPPPGWRAVLVGRVKASDRGFARALSAQLPAPGLTFAGEHADVLRWYQGLSVLVQPSWAEGYSMVLLEAMATGCCVVASALPYAKQLVEHGRTGLLFEPHDVRGLAALLAELAADPGRAARMGLAAAEEARARFGVEHEASALARVYDSVRAACPLPARPPATPGSGEP